VRETTMRTCAAVFGAVLAVGGLVFGCSVTTPGTEPVDGGDVDAGGFVDYDSAVGDAFAPKDPSRLIRGPQSYRDRTGAEVKVADGWKDTKRNEVCAPFLAGDRSLRCFPLEAVESWSLTVFEASTNGRARFADADCTRPAVVVDGAWKVPPKYLRIAYDGPSAHHAIAPVSKSTAREYFEGPVCDVIPDGGARDAAPTDAGCGECRRVAVPAGSEVYATGESGYRGELPASEFGEMVRY
jgi:hypothetical protein